MHFELIFCLGNCAVQKCLNIVIKLTDSQTFCNKLYSSLLGSQCLIYHLVFCMCVLLCVCACVCVCVCVCVYVCVCVSVYVCVCMYLFVCVCFMWVWVWVHVFKKVFKGVEKTA